MSLGTGTRENRLQVASQICSCGCPDCPGSHPGSEEGMAGVGWIFSFCQKLSVSHVHVLSVSLKVAHCTHCAGAGHKYSACNLWQCEGPHSVSSARCYDALEPRLQKMGEEMSGDYFGLNNHIWEISGDY